MRSFSSLAALPLVILLSTGHAAEGCTWATSVTDDTQIVIDLREENAQLGLSEHGVNTFDYVVNDLCQGDIEPGWQLGCGFSMWEYWETNGIDGLQRRDEFRDDTCAWAIMPDTIFF